MSKAGDAPLHLAASQLSPSAMTTLLAGGATADLLDSGSRTALHRVVADNAEALCATADCTTACQCVLVLLGARASLTRVDGSGATPLGLAKALGQKKLLKVMRAAKHLGELQGTMRSVTGL